MVLGSVASPSKALVSTRQGIAWGLAPRSEDSSVLVLTSPSRHYVDIRYALVGEATAGPFWAFAGQVTYTALPGLDGSTGVGLRGEWRHPIDSMGNVDGVDRADLFDLANGDQIEIGLLENPETGKEDRFMEYWTRPVESSQNDRCVVASLEEGGKMTGLAIQVGDRAQGIRQVSGVDTGVVTTRWLRVDGLWNRDTMGDANKDNIPMEWLLQEGRSLGDRHAGGKEWTIIEQDN